jgi:hypothetical protein
MLNKFCSIVNVSSECPGKKSFFVEGFVDDDDDEVDDVDEDDDEQLDGNGICSQYVFKHFNNDDEVEVFPLILVDVV